MKKQEIEKKLDELANDLCAEIEKQLGAHAEGLTLVGSCAVGKMSLARPDIGFVLFLKEETPAKAYLILGEIFTELIEKYADVFCVRPESRPWKSSYPRYKDKLEVAISPAIARMEEIHGDFPFGIPKNVLAGMKKMRKVVFGKDILGKLDTNITQDYIIQKVAFRDLGIFRLQLILAPTVYDLNTDYDLLLAESLNCGKMALRFGVEIAATKKELEDESYLKYFTNLKKMIPFYKKRYNQKTANSVKVILDARENYDKWRKDKVKAYLVFTEAYNLIDAIWGKLLSLAS